MVFSLRLLACAVWYAHQRACHLLGISKFIGLPELRQEPQDASTLVLIL